MDQIPLITSSTNVTLEHFWNAVMIYHDRPHVVNRKLAAISPVLFCKITLNCPRIKRLHEIFTREALLYEIRKLKNSTKITPEFIRNITEVYDKNAHIQEVQWSDFQQTDLGAFISLRILLPRNSQEKCLEIVIFDKERRTVTFFAPQEDTSRPTTPLFPYHIELTQTGNLRINVNSFEDADTASAEWLVDKLFTKILKWIENGLLEETNIKSLGLIAPDSYCTLYSDLKLKYGENLIKQWPQKAKTDPYKYVYEDIGIAAYLICLWRKTGVQNINFVDCGCGNGLLVYILNKEGFKGCGYDIRKREVWELYSNEADVRIGTITPESVFPDATWIIGNHSDELTPWIPVIALNSSLSTNYFVLPCCTYDFSGRKYARVNSKLSQYEDYLDYIKKISVICGFTTAIDKLRIPSTKRTCLVGTRVCKDTQVDDIRRKVSTFVAERLNETFQRRNSVEIVRNCTRLNKDLKERIVNLVVKHLLNTPCLLTNDSNGKSWNQGEKKNLKDLSEIISTKDKQQLKSECGGLQTLLKNHKYIFDVCSGAVSLQKPKSIQETDKYRKYICWFVRNHPDGCFFESEDCAYKHCE